ncbi:MAG: Crp/Fnr family transcriptional regulator [Alphaproteobacteria bacterium]|nr:Crp/Fnr family transcriptional regulator [Alphaproteobacteria bacterium]
MARVERVLADEALFRQGDPPEAIFVVLSGEFKATQVTPEGDRVVVRLVGPGDLAGHVSMFCNTPYPATPLAMTESIALAWTHRDFTSLMARHPALSLAVIRNMAQAIENAHTRLREAATERVERRVAHALLRLIKQSGHRIDGGIEISFPITRHDIALMTGATLYTVSRILSAWEEQGIVSGGRRHLVIRAPHALMKIAEEEAPTK